MRTFSTHFIAISTLLTLFSPALAQQPGGLRIMEQAEEGICRDEAASPASTKTAQRQAELARELTAMLKRTAEIQRRLSSGAGKDVRAELSRMIERTKRMTAELEGMAGGAKNP